MNINNQLPQSPQPNPYNNNSLQNPLNSNRQQSKIVPFEYSNKQEQSEIDKKTCKNFYRLGVIVTVITLSSFYFGFSLTYLGTIPQPTLQKYYGDVVNNATTLPILTGAMPVGGIFGSLLANIIMRYLSRKKLLIIVNIFAIAVNLIIQVTNIWVLLACRLATGVFVGIYMGVVPSYVKQLSPVSVSGTFGAFTQLQHLVGNVTSYLFGTFFYLAHFQGQFYMRFQLSFTTILIVLQMVLLVTGYIPESPNSLLLNNQEQEARKVLLIFNQEKDIDGIIAQKRKQNIGLLGDSEVIKVQQTQLTQKQTNKSMITNNQPQYMQQNIQVNKKVENSVQMNWVSYFLSFQLPLTQQFTGTNYVVTSITAITALYDSGLSHFTGLMANSIQLVSTSFSAYLLAKFGRRQIILIGNLSIGILNIFIAVVFYELDLNWGPGFPFGMTLIMLFNVLYGLSLGPTIWLFIPEIAKKRIVPIATATYWIGCSICVTIPPIITNLMHSPYATFFFFGCYQIALFIPNYFLVIQTKGLTTTQINQMFNRKAKKIF